LFAEREQFQAREELFDRVDALGRRVRQELGESLAAIDRHSQGLERVTTGSPEALGLYSRARDLMSRWEVEPAVVLLVAALDLDPDFAMAHSQLARAYMILGRTEGTSKHLARAYELRETLSDRERYSISGFYFLQQGLYAKGVESLEVLVGLYPDDLGAHQDLALAYYSLGNVSEAVEELRHVVRLDPYATQAYGNLILFLARIDETQEAIDVHRRAVERGLASPYFHWGLGLAFLGEGRVDEALAEFRSLEEAGGPYQDVGRRYVAAAAIYQGRFAAAEEQMSAEVTRARVAGRKASEIFLRLKLCRIYDARGETRRVRDELTAVLEAPDPVLSDDSLLTAGILLTGIGDLDGAKRVLVRLEARGGSAGGSFHAACVSNLTAVLALAEGEAGRSAERFRIAVEQYPQALSHSGLARAYQVQKDWERAAAEWKRVLGARGEILQDDFPADWVMAHLELARVFRRLDDPGQAREKYERFLEIWDEADDLPAVEQAGEELKELTGRTKPAPRAEP